MTASGTLKQGGSLSPCWEEVGERLRGARKGQRSNPNPAAPHLCVSRGLGVSPALLWGVPRGTGRAGSEVLPGEGNVNLYRWVPRSVSAKEKQAERTGSRLLFVSQTIWDVKAAGPAAEEHPASPLPAAASLLASPQGFPCRNPPVSLCGVRPEPAGAQELVAPASGAAQRKRRL